MLYLTLSKLHTPLSSKLNILQRDHYKQKSHIEQNRGHQISFLKANKKYLCKLLELHIQRNTKNPKRVESTQINKIPLQI